MALRPAKCYRKPHRPYTRISYKNPKKCYVKGVPRHKIAQFEMGVKKEYPVALYLVSERNVQIRHNALEAARVAVVKTLEKRLGKNAQYFIKLRVYPHHVLRENALATGAGADRFQQGMRKSFGKPIGTAAIVDKGQKILEVRIDKEHLPIGKDALRVANTKLPTPCRIVVEELKIAS